MKGAHQAPGAGTPAESDEPAGLGSSGGFRGQKRTDDLDCADAGADCKLIATATARAALLGIEARSIGPGAWLLRHAHGGCIGAVYGHEALAAAVGGFEAARDDVLALVQRLSGGGL